MVDHCVSVKEQERNLVGYRFVWNRWSLCQLSIYDRFHWCSKWYVSFRTHKLLFPLP